MPVVRVAESIYLGGPVSEHNQDNADKSIDQLVLSLHHNESYLNTLEEGERSVGLTEWNDKMVQGYTKLYSEATCHATEAKRNWKYVESLKTEAQLAFSKGSHSEAAEIEKRADVRVAEMEKEAGDFMDRHLFSLMEHCKTLHSVYRKKPPRVLNLVLGTPRKQPKN